MRAHTLSGSSLIRGAISSHSFPNQSPNQSLSLLRLPKSKLKAYLFGNFFRQQFEVPSGIVNGIRMTAYGAVGGGEAENGFAALLSHRDQAAVMFHGCQTIRILFLSKSRYILFIQNIFSVDPRNALYPFVVGLNGTLQELVGMAFQIVDDLLDYTGNGAETGKELGNDRNSSSSSFVC